MAKPVFAVDADDVLFPGVQAVVEYYNLTRESAYDSESFSFRKILLAEPRNKEDFSRLVEEFSRYFTSAEYFEYEPLPGARGALERLADRYSIVVVTARPAVQHEATVKWLDRWFPGTVSGVEFVFNGEWGTPELVPSKLPTLQRIGAASFVDDNAGLCRIADEAGIQSMLFGNYRWNRDEELPSTVRRVRDWDEIASVYA